MLPPSSILVAVDFSEQSRIALTFAALLAERCESRLHVAYAEHPLMLAAATEQGLDLLADSHAELARFIASAPAAARRPAAPIVNVGDAVSVILHAAGRVRADLIVLGARGMSGAGRLLFGSVAEGVLHQSTRSVLVIPDWWPLPSPADDAGRWIGPLIVGIDFSEPSLIALTAACALAQRLHTSVEAVHVVADLPVPDRWKPQAERVIHDRIDLARRDLARVTGSLMSPVPVTARVEQGPVVERLAEIAMPMGEQHPILVLGRKSTRTSTGVPGSIAYRAASLTRVPVLMHKESDL